MRILLTIAIFAATFALASCAVRYNPSQGRMTDHEGAQLSNVLSGIR